MPEDDEEDLEGLARRIADLSAEGMQPDHTPTHLTVPVGPEHYRVLRDLADRAGVTPSTIAARIVSTIASTRLRRALHRLETQARRERFRRRTRIPQDPFWNGD